MAYIKLKTYSTVVVDETGCIVSGSAQDLASHPAVLSGHYEIVDAEPTAPILERIIYMEPVDA